MFTRALCFSLLLHGVFLAAVVITFPIGDIHPTPVLHFLGSVLHTNEIVAEGKWSEGSVSDIVSLSSLSGVTNTQANRFWVNKLEPSKSRHVAERAKQQFKSKADEFGSTRLPKESVLDLGVDLDLPPRVPLKMKYHD